MSDNPASGRYQCDVCGDDFGALDVAKKHVIVEEMRPVNPEEVISRV